MNQVLTRYNKCIESSETSEIEHEAEVLNFIYLGLNFASVFLSLSLSTHMHVEMLRCKRKLFVTSSVLFMTPDNSDAPESYKLSMSGSFLEMVIVHY